MTMHTLTKKDISIIICTFNSRSHLEDCLLSLENQDYKQKEIIVVNDASTDDTAEFLQDYVKRTPLKLSLITNRINLGVAGSRNVGIQHATGQIIAFTDADCVTDPKWLSEILKAYERTDAIAVGGSVQEKNISNLWELTRKGHDFVARSEGYVPFIKGCNMSFQSAVLKKYMFNAEIKYGYEELLLCHYLTKDGFKIYYRPQAVVHHKHRTNLSGLFKQMYRRGMSSVWYLKKTNQFIMYKRHLLLLISILLLLFSFLTDYLFYLSVFLFAIVNFYLLKEEILFAKKSIFEMIITFPFTILVEFFHLFGAVVGVWRFHLLSTEKAS